jgi:plastocyanin domain-containing protein
MESLMHRSKTLVLSFALLALSACNKKSDGTGTPATDGRPTIKVAVDGTGYHPSEAKAKAGQPVRLEFTRTTDETCGQELVFPSLSIKKALPLNQPVAVDVTMPTSGKLAFTCGMDMYKGAIVAE